MRWALVPTDLLQHIGRRLIDRRHDRARLTIRFISYMNGSSLKSEFSFLFRFHEFIQFRLPPAFGNSYHSFNKSRHTALSDGSAV